MTDANSHPAELKDSAGNGNLKSASLINTIFSDKANSVFIAAIVLGLTFIVAPLLGKYWFPIDAYQANLVICLGIALILSAFGAQAEAISGLLTDRDRDLLLSAAGDSDRTVRVYATEFLFDLSDPGAASLGIKRAADTNDETARYQWLFQAQGGWLKLAPEQKRDLRSSLDQIKSHSEGKTRELLGKFV
jgi:hypothetical protein